MVQIYLDFVSKNSAYTTSLRERYTIMLICIYNVRSYGALFYVTLFNHKRPMINRILANADRRNARPTPTILNQPMKIKSSGMEKVFEVCGARFQSVFVYSCIIYLWGITFIARMAGSVVFLSFSIPLNMWKYVYVSVYLYHSEDPIENCSIGKNAFIGYLSTIKLDPSI